jgi:hypothetical protein
VPERLVPLLSKRIDTARLIQKAQHVIPAVPLLMHGLARLGHEGDGWSRLLGVAEAATSALVLVAFVRQARATRLAARASHDDGADHGHAAHGIDWVDLCLGGMLAIEVWAHWHESGHIKRPTVLLAAAMVIIGLAHGRIAAWGARRRSLRVDDHGIHVPSLRFSGRFDATWDQLAAIDVGDAEARLARHDGTSRTLNLRDLHHAGAVREALAVARLRLAPADVRADADAPDDGPATP